MKRAAHNTAEYEKMVEEATVDCYSDDEVFMGMVYALQNKLTFPFDAMVIGKNVTVVDIDDGKSGLRAGILAKVVANGKLCNVSLAALHITDKTKKGRYNAKWIGVVERWVKEG